MAAIIDPAAGDPDMRAADGPQELRIEHRPVGPPECPSIPFAFHGTSSGNQLFALVQLGSVFSRGRKIRKRLIVAKAANVVVAVVRLDMKIPVVPGMHLQERNVGPGLEAALELSFHLVELVALRTLHRNPSGYRAHEFSAEQEVENAFANTWTLFR